MYECKPCGVKWKGRIEGHTLIWECPVCGNHVVTTWFPPLEAEQTVYVIHLQAQECKDIDKLRAVARLRDCNFLQARAFLARGGELLRERAPEIQEACRRLESVGLPYTVSPVKKMKHILLDRFKEFGASDAPSMWEFFEEKPYLGQEKIVHFLRTQGRVSMVRMEMSVDCFTGERIPGEYSIYYKKYDRFSWSSTLAYYVEKYNLRLLKEFEEMVLNNETL